MTAITHQKQMEKQAIVKILSHYLTQHPDSTYTVAISLAARLAAKMTLTELKHWHEQLASLQD
jgi:hypothetical protein